jgi:hypothetical protein
MRCMSDVSKPASKAASKAGRLCGGTVLERVFAIGLVKGVRLMAWHHDDHGEDQQQQSTGADKKFMDQHGKFL